MTQEEKARAYDEALNKIKPLYEQAKKDGNPIWSTYEYLIPDLAESEDEKIRKSIIHILQVGGYMSPEEKGKALAYLEKQKELLESGKGLYYYDGEKAIYCGDPVTEENRRIFAMCQQEKQKEQKFAGWNEDWQKENIQTRFAFYTYKDDPCTLYLSNVFVEETSRNKGFGTKILAVAEKVAETLGTTYIRLKVKQNSPANAWYRKNGYMYVAFEDGYDWLEKNLEYVKSNKQGWDKFDEDCLKRAVWYIENPAPSVVKDTNLALWLKLLPGRFNLEPKQQGWRHYTWHNQMRFDYGTLVKYENGLGYEIVTSGNKPSKEVSGEYIFLKDICLQSS